MQLLVLGGTAWLGGYVVADALAHGHRVTCVARGESGTVPQGSRLHRADRNRDDALDQVAGQSWDAAIDVARQPGQVRRAMNALANSVDTFVFVSSGNVYADIGTPGDDESAELLPPLERDVMETMETYGEARWPANSTCSTWWARNGH